jgi:hypothetical protein
MRKVKVYFGQTLEDISLREYGCIEGVVTLMADNNLGPDSLLYSGQTLVIQDEVPELSDDNLFIKDALESAGIIPVTGIAGETPAGLYTDDEYVTDGYFEDE